MAGSTSFRLSAGARSRLSERARQEGLSATALLERLIVEGVDALEYPGIVYRGSSPERRAGLAGGPDVWEVVKRLRELPGGEEDRIETLASETEIHPRQIRVALEFASAHPEAIEARILRNEQAIISAESTARRRRAILG